jgi:hypothetical protein
MMNREPRLVESGIWYQTVEMKVADENYQQSTFQDMTSLFISTTPPTATPTPLLMNFENPNPPKECRR